MMLLTLSLSLKIMLGIASLISIVALVMAILFMASKKFADFFDPDEDI